MLNGWRICGVDGCLVSPFDRICPACEFRLLGPRPQHTKGQP